MFASRAYLIGACLILILLAGLLAGCPGQPEKTETPAAVDTASATPAAATAEAVPDSAAPEYPEDTIAARPDFPVKCVTSFIGAAHTGDPGQLSDLSFTANLEQDTKTLGDTRIDLTSADPQAFAEFKLPEYLLAITPVIDAPIELEKGSYGSYGGYRIELANPAGDPQGVIEIDKTGKLERASGANGFQLNVMLAAPEEQLYTYGLIAPAGSVKEPELVIAIKIGEFETMAATDSAQGTYEYRFPGMELTIFGKKLAADQDYMRAADTRAVAGGFNAGGGGGGLGSGGRGGGRRGGG